MTCNFPLGRETYSHSRYWPLVIPYLTRSSKCFPEELETVITKRPQLVTTPKIIVKNSFGVFLKFSLFPGNNELLIGYRSESSELVF